MAYNREYYLNNKSKHDLRNRKWRKQNPDKIKLFSFKTKLKANYNLSYAEYTTLLETQNNACAICSRVDKLVIDHCHLTSKVRGLLCSTCNLGLGHFKYSTPLLNKAINYLNDTQDKAPE